MCYPGASSQAKAVGRARDNFAIEGVNLNNLKDTPRQFALRSNSQFPPIAGVSLPQVNDITRQFQGKA